MVEVVSGLWIAIILIGILSVQQGFIFALIRDRNIELKEISANRHFQPIIEGDLFARRVSRIFVCKNGSGNEFLVAFWERTTGIKKFIVYYFRTKKSDEIDLARRYVIDPDNIPEEISMESVREYIRSVEGGIYRRPSDKLYSSSIAKLCKNASISEKGNLLHYCDAETSYYF